jgi:hypothetical protein
MLAASSAVAQEIGHAGRGQAAAMRLCSECHAVEQGRSVSPMFTAPPFVAVANTPGMTAMALSAALQTAHRSMPSLVLEPADFSDVIAHILSLRRGP